MLTPYAREPMMQTVVTEPGPPVTWCSTLIAIQGPRGVSSGTKRTGRRSHRRPSYTR